jgi:hypothetical protein
VIDLVGPAGVEDLGQIGGVGKITAVEGDPGINGQAIPQIGCQPMNHVAFVQKQLHEVGTILSIDAGDEGDTTVATHKSLPGRGLGSARR